MAQILTVCRVGLEWAFRDVTGAYYANSSELTAVIDAANVAASRLGAHVSLSPEAEAALRSEASQPIDSIPGPKENSPRRFGPFWARLWKARRRK